MTGSASTLASALAAHPRVPLAHVPTPFEPMERLAAHLGGPALWVKRDDCTGLAFGGNKIRQLEFYLGAARRADADTVLITGAVQSNFVRSAAAAARRLGLEAHVQLEERVPGVDENYRTSGNVLLDRLLGAEIHPYPEGEDEAGADGTLGVLADRLRVAGRRPYVIHLGIDHPPLGALGYVAAAAELVADAEARSLEPDAVVVGSGSGLTHAGLLVGLRALGAGTRVIGVCVRRPADAQRERVRRRAEETADLIGRPGLVGGDDVEVTDCALAPGYGRPGPATLSAITSAARLEGLILDPVYTGKVMAGLLALVAAGTLRPGADVVFLHTGGAPALFGYQAALAGYLDTLDRPG